MLENILFLLYLVDNGHNKQTNVKFTAILCGVNYFISIQT